MQKAHNQSCINLFDKFEHFSFTWPTAYQLYRIYALKTGSVTLQPNSLVLDKRGVLEGYSRVKHIPDLNKACREDIK